MLVSVGFPWFPLVSLGFPRFPGFFNWIILLPKLGSGASGLLIGVSSPLQEAFHDDWIAVHRGVAQGRPASGVKLVGMLETVLIPWQLEKLQGCLGGSTQFNSMGAYILISMRTAIKICIFLKQVMSYEPIKHLQQSHQSNRITQSPPPKPCQLSGKKASATSPKS